jgi:hypothetical protein
MMTTEERIDALEKKVKDGNRKDVWDILSVIGSLLIPVAIFFAGQQYANAMKAAELAAALNRDASNREIAKANLDIAEAGKRVSQANLLLGAIEALASETGPGKRVAISAILLAMPVEGPSIVRDLTRGETSPQLLEYASNSLTERKVALIGQLYASSGGERIEAYNGLLQNWGNDSSLPPLLAQRARQAFADTNFPGRTDGIYNTLVLLAHMNRAALAPHSADLRLLADQMRPVGPRVSDRANTLLSRLP